MTLERPLPKRRSKPALVDSLEVSEPQSLSHREDLGTETPGTQTLQEGRMPNGQEHHFLHPDSKEPAARRPTLAPTKTNPHKTLVWVLRRVTLVLVVTPLTVGRLGKGQVRERFCRVDHILSESESAPKS